MIGLKENIKHEPFLKKLSAVGLLFRKRIA